MTDEPSPIRRITGIVHFHESWIDVLRARLEVTTPRCSELCEAVFERDEAIAALQTERERAERYRKALEFYRSKGSWECDRADFGSTSVAVPHTSPIEYDRGEIARKALDEK